MLRQYAFPVIAVVDKNLFLNAYRLTLHRPTASAPLRATSIYSWYDVSSSLKSAECNEGGRGCHELERLPPGVKKAFLPTVAIFIKAVCLSGASFEPL